jgi:hypothetical protein
VSRAPETSPLHVVPVAPAAVAPSPTAAPAPADPAPSPESGGLGGDRASETPEGRKAPRHDEKVTFYCTASDLTRIERARLALRAEHRLASDRGRIVRAALTEILDDFEKRGADSALVARLRDSGPSSTSR